MTRNEATLLVAVLACAPIAPIASGQVTFYEHANLKTLTLPDPGASTFDFFGSSVDVSGDTMVVGAPGYDGSSIDEGRAWVFRFDTTLSLWTFEATLDAGAEADAFDRFGCVAIDGDTIVVGAFGDDAACGSSGCDAGAAYVFERSGAIWGAPIKLTASDAQTGAEFGGVAIDGDRIVVGAQGHDSGGLQDSGRAYVFVRDGVGGWCEQFQLEASDKQPGDGFGIPAISGDTLVIGAWQHDHSGGDLPSSGSAYVFDFVSGGDACTDTWLEVAELIPSEPEVEARFGESVTIDATTIAVGACHDDYECNEPPEPCVDAGRVYVFTLTTSWSEQAIVAAPEPGAGDLFGASLDVQADRLIVGAPNDDISGTFLDGGKTHAYERNGVTWECKDTFRPENGCHDQGDLFGTAVGLDGDWVVAGAFFRDDPGTGTSFAGSAYAFGVTELDLIEHYCFGDGGDGLGCTDCPCSNNTVGPTPGGCENEEGRSGVLTATGVPRAFCDSLRFDFTGGIALNSGVLVSGDLRQPFDTGNPCFGEDSGIQSAMLNGLRCIGMNLLRHGSRPFDGNGDTTVGWGPPDGPPGGIVAFNGFVAGQVRTFQVFYREDPFDACSQGQNTSNGVEVVFLP